MLFYFNVKAYLQLIMYSQTRWPPSMFGRHNCDIIYIINIVIAIATSVNSTNLVRCGREFVINVVVITKFDRISKLLDSFSSVLTNFINENWMNLKK